MHNGGKIVLEIEINSYLCSHIFHETYFQLLILDYFKNVFGPIVHFSWISEYVREISCDWKLWKISAKMKLAKENKEPILLWYTSSWNFLPDLKWGTYQPSSYLHTSAKSSKIIRLGKWLFPTNNWCLIFGRSLDAVEIYVIVFEFLQIQNEKILKS